VPFVERVERSIAREASAPGGTQNREESMSIYEPSPSPWTSRMLSIFRIVAGVIFLSSGTMKIFGFPENPMPNMPPVELWSQVGIGGLMEVVGGVLIVLGLFTRPTAFILAGEMAVAYFQFHQPTAFWPTNNGGIPAVLYCFFFLYLVFAGAGAWSLDAMLARARGSRAYDQDRSPAYNPAHA
jgi:putative oxidoreductase